MGDEASGPVDMVVFLDANMPNMDKCSGNCANKELVFCVHRFTFLAHVIHPGNGLKNLNDFQVIQYFLKLIRKNQNLHGVGRKPLFVIVTKDHNFLQDAEYAYKKARKAKDGFNLTFGNNSVKDGELEIVIEVISCQNYGTNRQDNLRCTIRELNKYWNV